MYTQCPHCQTCFRVAEAHLKAAKGKVRCGSCKEIFDATKHLYDGVPAADSTPAKKSPATKPTAPPQPTSTPPASASNIEPPPPRYNEILPGGPEIPEHDLQHIDLSTPPDRTNAPDQSAFMESMVDGNSRYNNLDEIGSIPIPGEADFTESFIKFASDEPEDEVEQASHEEPTPKTKPNLYEDKEALESPATTQEQEGIDALYSAADTQMHEEIDAQQLNRDIEALLDDAMAFDDDEPKPQAEKPAPVGSGSAKKQNNLSGFEDELDHLNFNLDTDIPMQLGDGPQLVPIEDDIEPLDVVSSKDIWAKKNSPAKDNDVAPKADVAKVKHQDIDKSELDNFLDQDDDNISPKPEMDFDEFGAPATDSHEIDTGAELQIDALSPKAEDLEIDLPSPDHEIPKALRSSFENFEPHIRPIGVSMAMIAAIVVLVIGLLGQIIFFRSYQLANLMPSLSPMLTSLCNTLPCRYSGSSDITKIEVLNRDMRSHPSQKNALLVSTAFVNKAPFNQPYPIIAIKLFDLSGDTVATRYFKPEEYLENLYSKFLLMEAGTPVHITLAVLDPGDDAVNFEFSFL